MDFAPVPARREPGLCYHLITTKNLHTAGERLSGAALEASSEGEAVVLLIGKTVARVVCVHVGIIASVQRSKFTAIEIALCYIVANMPGPTLWPTRTTTMPRTRPRGG